MSIKFQFYKRKRIREIVVVVALQKYMIPLNSTINNS